MMPQKHLTFAEGTADKFWKIKRTGLTQTVTYGRTGTAGRTVTKEFDSADAAKASFDSLVEQKLSKGYIEVGSVAQRTKKTPGKKAKTEKATRKASAKKQRQAQPARKRATQTKARTPATPKRGSTSKAPFFKPLSSSEKKYYVPLSAVQVKHFETRFGVKCPKSLIKLLTVQNGRQVLSPAFEFGRKSYELPEIPPIREDGGLEPLTVGYPDHLQMIEGQLPDPHLVFPLCGDGHYFIALDYRVKGPKQEPAVIYLDIEGKPWQTKIADSFAKFLAVQCRPKQQPRVRVDLADPDCQIGYAERDYVMKNPLDGKPIQCEERHWLFLTEKHVACFEYNSRRKRVGMDKFSEKPESETWERHYVKLADITSVSVTMWNAAWTRRKVLDVSTSPANKGVRYDMSERDNRGGWQNKRGGPIIYFYFHGAPKNLAECKARIAAAMKSAGR